MKTAITCVVQALLGGIFMIGCVSMMVHYKYSVSFQNIGTREIRLKDIALYESVNSSAVGCGDLLPSQAKDWLYCNHKPRSKVVFFWEEQKTKKTTELIVPIVLPAQFDTESSEIIFYIDPDHGKVCVAYAIFDKKSDKKIIVDSVGRLFDVKSMKRQ